MDHMVGTQQRTRPNNHPLNIIIGLAYYKLLFEIILMCRMVRFINVDTQKLEPYSKTKSKRREQKNKSLLEQTLGGKKKSHPVWHVVETMSALFITLCLRLKGENPGDFRDVRDAVFVFFIKVQEMVVWFLSAFHQLQSQMFPDVFKTREMCNFVRTCCVPCDHLSVTSQRSKRERRREILIKM